MAHETERCERWTVSEVPAAPNRGTLHTKTIDFDLDKGAAGHLNKIEIHDIDPEEAERLAMVIAIYLNADEARSGN